VYYVIVICNLDPGIEATACACEILYVYVLYCDIFSFLVLFICDCPNWCKI